jgi:hypothetical protein
MNMLSSSGFIQNVYNTGLSVFFGVRGGVYQLTSFVSRTIYSVNELAEMNLTKR